MAETKRLSELEKKVERNETLIFRKTTLSKVAKANLDFTGNISFTSHPTINGVPILTSTDIETVIYNNSTQTITNSLSIINGIYEYIITSNSLFDIDFSNFVFSESKNYSFRLLIISNTDLFYGNTVSGITVNSVPKLSSFQNIHSGTGVNYIIQNITVTVDSSSNVIVLSNTTSYSTTESNNKIKTDGITIENNLDISESDSMIVLKTDEDNGTGTTQSTSKSLFDLSEFSVVSNDSINNTVCTGQSKTIFFDESTLLIKCKIPASIAGMSTDQYYYLPLLKVVEN